MARHRHGAASLLTEERGALTRLLSDSDLLGMERFLLPDRAHALADRARLMLQLAGTQDLASSEMPAVRSVLRGSIITQAVNYRIRYRRGISR
jgi:hypothetical protein